MTVTGYEFTYRNETVGLCPTHREELGINVDDCSSKVKTTMIRHGNGGSPCAVCGFDVLDALSSRALSDRHDTPREYATVSPEDRQLLSLGMAAELISYAQNIDVWAFIDLAPGEEPEEIPFRVSDNGDVIAKQVRHGENADETLYIELSTNTDTYKQMHDRATDVEQLLQNFGLHTSITPDPFQDGNYWHVLALQP